MKQPNGILCFPKYSMIDRCLTTGLHGVTQPAPIYRGSKNTEFFNSATL